MPKDKASEPTPTSNGQALEKRVIAIMGGKPAAQPTEPAKAPDQAPATAPELSSRMSSKTKAQASVEAAQAAPQAQAASNQSAAAGDAVDGAPDPALLDDKDNGQAVDDIVRKEGDIVLTAEEPADDKVNSAPKAHHAAALRRLLKNKWVWVGAAVIIIAVFALPFTRYKLLGLVLSKQLSVSVTDSKTNTPVSNVFVSLEGKTVKTDAAGKAKLKVPVGTGEVLITKQYYETYRHTYLVGLKSGGSVKVALVATGRQVPITVVNKVTGQPLGAAEIKVLSTSAKTSRKGQATIVLPTTKPSDMATISLSGYNTVHAPIAVTSNVVSGNTISLTPAGQVYFLSNLSGTIDVVKTNLDGSGRQTILAGTGDENADTTRLLASRDWHYLVLEAQRSGTQPGLYLINTANDKVTEFDSGNAGFTLVGWSGHYFVYDVQRNTVPQWQSAHEALKSYNADTGQLNLLDQNQAAGSAGSYGYQTFTNFYIVSGAITYTTEWYGFGAYDLSGDSDTVRIVQPSGQGKKDYQSFAASTYGSPQAVSYAPDSVYYSIYNLTSQQTAYYGLQGQNFTTLSSLTADTFDQAYATYLLSPSGKLTFWTELRDGQNSLFVGNQTAQNQKQISSGEYAPYGWYGDGYVLVSKNSSQLYIMPASGLPAGKQPLKITDYYKPPQTYSGYGYGYGGL